MKLRLDVPLPLETFSGMTVVCTCDLNEGSVRARVCQLGCPSACVSLGCFPTSPPRGIQTRIYLQCAIKVSHVKTSEQ